MLLVFGLLLVPLSVAGAGELPSPGGKPLSAIVKSVEEGKVGVIAEAHTAHFAPVAHSSVSEPVSIRTAWSAPPGVILPRALPDDRTESLRHQVERHAEKYDVESCKH